MVASKTAFAAATFSELEADSHGALETAILLAGVLVEAVGVCRREVVMLGRTAGCP